MKPNTLFTLYLRFRS